ncbi:MAG: 50S ribosomal protein L15e [Candidatus Nitrosocaldaceae archaeon]
MSMYKHIAETWKRLLKENSKEIRDKAIKFRREPTIVRIDKPSRLDRARMLGYKAKQGFVVVRAKVGRGGMRKDRPRSGRRPKHLGVVKIKQSISMKNVAERRVSKKYPNLSVLGSYYLYKDAKNYWYEVLLVDKNHPVVYKDREMRHRLGLIAQH